MNKKELKNFIFREREKRRYAKHCKQFDATDEELAQMEKERQMKQEYRLKRHDQATWWY